MNLCAGIGLRERIASDYAGCFGQAAWRRVPWHFGQWVTSMPGTRWIFSAVVSSGGEGDGSIGDILNAVIRDGDAMRVAP